MSDRAQELAARFERANDDVIELVERCPDDRWQATLDGDGRTFGIVAHHIAAWQPVFTNMARRSASGEPLAPSSPISQGAHAFNAGHARRYAAVTKAEVIEALRRNGASVSAAIRGFTDEQLDRQSELRIGPLRTEEFVERFLIGHARSHLAGLREAAGV